MRKKNSEAVAPWRFYVVLIVLCSLLALLIGRVLSLQVLDIDRGYQFLQGQGEMRSVRTVEIPPCTWRMRKRPSELVLVAGVRTEKTRCDAAVWRA